MGKDVSALAERLREAIRDETPASCSSDDRDAQPPPPDLRKPNPTTAWSVHTPDQSFLVPLFDRRIWEVEEGDGDTEVTQHDTEIWQEPLLQVSQNNNHNQVLTCPISETCGLAPIFWQPSLHERSKSKPLPDERPSCAGSQHLQQYLGSHAGQLPLRRCVATHPAFPNK